MVEQERYVTQLKGWEEDAQTVCTAANANKRWNKTQNKNNYGNSAAQILSSNAPKLVWEEKT